MHDDCDFKFEYDVVCYDVNKEVICNYDIEADCAFDAKIVAREFCKDDYPNRKIGKVSVMNVGLVKGTE
jgi:hypothetical protein